MSQIKTYNKYASLDSALKEPYVERDANPHGLSTGQINEMRDRFENFMPGLASKYASQRDKFNDLLPDGASWSKSAQMIGGGGGNSSTLGGGKTMFSNQMPYQPEFSSPDRQQYPVHRILANRYWRLFHKLDPVIGNVIDMYADLPWSAFELTGEGVEGEIKSMLEYMCSETQLLAMLPYFVKEFMVVGEVIPHTFFDSSKGVWTHIALHNPDQVEVVDAPFIKMEPIVEFIPDDRLRAILTSNAPALRAIRDRMPPELLSRLNARQNIPLSPINSTFIPRKLHPYDTRGTSIISRMWRVLMYEDAIFNASIQTARRSAAPLKVAKLGNAATGWIPPPEQERKLLELLAQAELDPQAWLVYHYGVQFELAGAPERAMSIKNEWEMIERVKLVAMGVSKGFLHGEVVYSAAATGLQIFLSRLKAMRLFFEQKWLYPKFFKTIAEINGWVKPKPSELIHRYKVKRSAAELEEQNAFIIPKIRWEKSLDPQINTELIAAMANLEQLGVKFSKTTKMATVGYSYEEETKKIHREMEFEKRMLPPLPAQAPQEGAGGPPMGGGGGSPMPPPTPETPPMGEEGPVPPGMGDTGMPQGVDANPPPITPPGAAKQGVEKKNPPTPGKPSQDGVKSEIWVNDKFGNWDVSEIADLKDLLTTADTESAFWAQMMTKDFKRALVAHDDELIQELMDNYLRSQDYPDTDIEQLHDILKAEKIFGNTEEDLESMISDQGAALDYATKVAEIIKMSSGNTSDTLLTGIDIPKHT